jgi:CelD/BcsL family acetyltransferase involved in cellulose biosynthesis
MSFEITSPAFRTDSRPATGGLALRLIRSRAEIAPIWRRLEQSLHSTGLANSWAWTDCWLDAYGDLVPHWFVVAERAGHPVGVAMLTRGRAQRRGPVPLRTAHIGTAGEGHGRGIWVEYNRVLIAPADRAGFLALLLTAPGTRPLAVDVLELNGFDPDELPATIRTRLREREEICHVANLTGPGEIIDSFDRDTRRKLRKGIKEFTAAFGALTTEWVESPERAQTVLTELIAHHQARWTSAGKPGSFADDRFERFHRDLVERLLPERRIVLARVTAGETLVGIFYGFVEDGVVYHYQWGLPQFEDNRLSPGFVTGYLVMEEARRRDLAELNWLAGDSRYKRDLSNAQRSLIWAEKTLSPWHMVVTGLISLYAKLPDTRKQMIRGRA